MITRKHLFQPFVLTAGLILAAAPLFAQTPDIHVLGVSRLTPTNDAAWRSPDGKLMDTPPKADERFDKLHITPAATEQGVRLLIEIKHAPKERSCSVKIDGATGIAWTSFSQPDDTRLYAVEANLPANVQSADVHVGVSIAEWRDAAEKPSGAGAVVGAIYGPDSKPKTIEVIFSDFSQFGPVLGLSVATALNADQDTRIVGIDSQGAVVDAQMQNDQSVNTIEQRTVTFPGKTAGDITSVKLQARPYEWRDFKGVKLPPVK